MAYEKTARPTVSIAMCTYNGERFLAGQLDSIKRQTVLPTELVIQDDGSSDNTRSLVERMARNMPFPVRFTANAQRLGPSRNFETCIARCTGDIIVLTDQDDLWMLDRIAQTLAAYNDTGVTFTYADAPLIDDYDRPIGRTIFTTVPVSRADHRLLVTGGDLLPLIMRYGVLYGATMSISRDLALTASPFPEGWSHDEWLSLVGAAMGAGISTPPVMYYRQHSRQVVGAGTAGLRAVVAGVRNKRDDYYSLERQRYEAALTTAMRHPALSGRLASHLRRKLTFLNERRIIHSGGITIVPPLLRTLANGSHKRFSGGLRSIAKDIYIAARSTISPPRAPRSTL